MQRRHNCSPAASFANCVMTLYLLKVHLQTFLSVPITQKCQILSCDTLVGNERYIAMPHFLKFFDILRTVFEHCWFTSLSNIKYRLQYIDIESKFIYLFYVFKCIFLRRVLELYQILRGVYGTKKLRTTCPDGMLLTR